MECTALPPLTALKTYVPGWSKVICRLQTELCLIHVDRVDGVFGDLLHFALYFLGDATT